MYQRRRKTIQTANMIRLIRFLIASGLLLFNVAAEKSNYLRAPSTETAEASSSLDFGILNAQKMGGPQELKEMVSATRHLKKGKSKKTKVLSQAGGALPPASNQVDGQLPPPTCAGLLGIQCPDGLLCVNDPTNCGIAADCLGICVNASQTCGGFVGKACPDNLTCIDDPSDDCDPNNGGADCGGICVPDLKSDVPGFADLCPTDVPGTGDSCPADFVIGERCGYGSVCCCGDCFTETTCTCTDVNTFECATIAIKCSANCPIDITVTSPPAAIEPIGCTPSMSVWPDLVGKTGEDAKAFLESSEPCLTRVEIVLEGSAVTMDYVFTRVRIFVNKKDIVVSPPMIG